MKQKFTLLRKANRGPSKTMLNRLYSMSVLERRLLGVKAFDSAKYNEKHGIILNTTEK